VGVGNVFMDISVSVVDIGFEAEEGIPVFLVVSE
jgi:hypothetical protein